MSTKNHFLVTLHQTGETVFSIRELALLFPETSPSQLKSQTHYYFKKGQLKRLRKGLYALPAYNPLEAAAKLYTPSYISLETVLAREGIIFQYYETIFAVGLISRAVTMDSHIVRYRRIKPEILLNTKGIITGKGYSIATKERAFLDALYLYRNYHFDNRDAIDLAVIRNLLPVYGSPALEKKINFIFPHAEH